MSAAVPSQQGLEARRLAADILTAVLSKGRTLEDALRTNAFAAMPERDRAFTRRLVATVLRRLGQIDSLIGARLTAGRLPGRAEGVRMPLRLGAAEIVFLRTPAHAAINSAVSLAQQSPETQSYSGLVNAVLRRLMREVPDEARAEALAPVSLNTPAWLFDRWVNAYGMQGAEEIVAAHTKEPPLDITVKEGSAAWAEKLGANVLPSGSLRRPLGGRIEELPGFAEGAWWIQDAAAAIAARLLPVAPGDRVLDLCAAPGGKSALFAAQGAEVAALDRDAERLGLLKKTMQRLNLRVRIIEADALEFTPERPFARIFLDAPCTATGTIRRHPDIPWLKRAEDMAALAQTQSALLRAACTMLAPGGVLVYAVCSLEPEEGPDVVTRCLGELSSLRRMPILAAETPAAEFVTGAGDLRTLPSHWPAQGGLDGFYAARLTRA